MFTKRFIVALVICLLLTPFAVNTAQAQEPGPCYFPIFLAEDITIHSSVCSSITFILITIDFSPGLVNETIGAFDLSFSFTGPDGPIYDLGPDETAAFWDPIFAVPAANWGLVCPGHNQVWLGFWSKDMGAIEVGTYYLSADMVLRHPITDALQACTLEDGTPIQHWMTGPSESLSASTITVIP